VNVDGKNPLELLGRERFGDPQLPFGVDSTLVEPGVYRTGIHDHLMPPSDAARISGCKSVEAAGFT